jgi:sigma-B regulation protein RsbU (phosphoserine phosphatase)
MQQSLKQYVDDLKTTTTAKASIESELQVASKIQMSMLPRCFPKREGLDLYAEMTPAKDVGGDLYNFILRGDQLYICVGDVSGKGIPASLFMAQTSRLFRALAKEEGMQPADMACRMNDELAEGNDQCMFVTLFIGLVHLQTGRLDYCCCGHNAPVIDGEYLQMTNKNQPIGLMGGLLYKSESIDDIRGRQILIYTDGLNEAENGAFELLGNERLLKLMADKKALSAKEVIAQLSEAVIQYRDGAEPSDDLTIMCLRINEKDYHNKF